MSALFLDSDGWQQGELPGDAVELGRLGDAWGVKGWLKVLSHSTDPQTLLSAPHWWLLPPTPPHDRGFRLFSSPVCVEVSEVKPHADTLVARFPGLTDRTTAEQLRGVRIFVSREDFPDQKDPDEFYWVDLIGLDVVNREGVHLGVVSHLLATGPTSVLVLGFTQGEGADAKPGERMIPFVSAYVDNVDQSARRITVDWQPEY